MDNNSKSPPHHISPSDYPSSSSSFKHDPPINSPSPDDDDMATLVAHSNPLPLTALPGGVNKRYRPAPAKTFQCRGYGECRMVFSRSEHLARHIRKHTGERPFTCHCGKQFSRLDNLRQHAQTVHADKQEQNERMMRELTSLHATMAAANKAGQPRGKRGHVASATASSSGPHDNGLPPMNPVKQEDIAHIPIHQRPGTSTGYEGDHNIYQGPTWHVQTSNIDRPTSRPTNSHSFRDPGQSFRAPSASNSSTFNHQQQQQSQSFLPFSSDTFNFSLPDPPRDGRPGSSSSRPPTAGGPDPHNRSLPPLSAVVSASIPPPSSSQPFPFSSQSSQHVLPLPGSFASFRRPSTATRPGTAPATYHTARPAYAGGPGLVSRPELSVPLGYGRAGDLASAAAAISGYDAADLPASPTGGAAYDSPFSFHPPAIPDAQSAAAESGGPLTSSPSVNPRKRPFPGADGPDDDPRREPDGSAGPPDYEYGSESRPQSRRLSVMELCNDTDANAGIRAFLSLSGTAGTGGSRPNTSSELVSSASALALVDRAPLASSPLLTGAPPAAAAAAPPTAATSASSAPPAPGGGPQEFGGGGVSPAFRRGIPSPTSVPSTILPTYRGSYVASPALSNASTASRSPRSSPSSAAFAAAARSAAAAGLHSGSSSPAADAAAASLSRRGTGGESQHDQVRISVASPHSPAAVGMRV